jgi:hypothetical protein
MDIIDQYIAHIGSSVKKEVIDNYKIITVNDKLSLPFLLNHSDVLNSQSLIKF